MSLHCTVHWSVQCGITAEFSLYSVLYAVTTSLDRDVKAKLSELGKVILLEQEGPMRSYLYDRPTLIFQSWEWYQLALLVLGGVLYNFQIKSTFEALPRRCASEFCWRGCRFCIPRSWLTIPEYAHTQRRRWWASPFPVWSSFLRACRYTSDVGIVQIRRPSSLKMNTLFGPRVQSCRQNYNQDIKGELWDSWPSRHYSGWATNIKICNSKFMFQFRG